METTACSTATLLVPGLQHGHEKLPQSTRNVASMKQAVRSAVVRFAIVSDSTPAVTEQNPVRACTCSTAYTTHCSHRNAGEPSMRLPHANNEKTSGPIAQPGSFLVIHRDSNGKRLRRLPFVGGQPLLSSAVRPAISGYRPCLVSVDSPGIEPGSRACGPGAVPLDHESLFCSRPPENQTLISWLQDRRPAIGRTSRVIITE